MENCPFCKAKEIIFLGANIKPIIFGIAIML